MYRPPVVTSLLLCSFALLSGCNADKSPTVAANDGNETTIPATTPTPTPAPNPNSNSTTQQVSVAGKAYLRSDGTSMVVFNAGGTATLYSANAGSSVLTWAMDGNTLTLATANGTQRLTLAGDGKAFADGDSRYVLPQAVTVQQLVGQQLLETPAPCCSRSWTFKAGEVDLFLKQGSGGGSSTLKLGTVDGMSGVLSVQGQNVFGQDVSGWLAWLDGELDKNSRWVYVHGDRLELMSVKNNTSVPNPTPANIAPVATLDTATVKAGESVTINVLANDTDPNGDTLSIASYGQGANGTVTQAGNNLVYTPKAGFTGTDSFSYTVNDGKGAETTGTVRVTVKAIPVTVLTATTSADSIAMIFRDTTGITLGEVTGGRVTLSTNAIVFFPANQKDAGTGTVSYVDADGKHYRIDIEITAKVEGGGDGGGGGKECPPNTTPTGDPKAPCA